MTDDSPEGKTPGAAEIFEDKFLETYLTPGTEQFLKPGKAYKMLRPHVMQSTASTGAKQILHRARVRQKLSKLLKASGLDLPGRMKSLSAIADGNVISKVTRKKLVDGELVTDSVVESEPSAGDRLHVLDIVNRLTGDYKKADIIMGEAAQDLKKLKQKVLEAEIVG